MVTRRNRIHGAKTGDRDKITRLRASQTELDFMDSECAKRGTTRAYAIRLALVREGLLPHDTPLADKEHEAPVVTSPPRKVRKVANA